MTAINVLLQRDRGWLITDGAWYDELGIVLNLAPKSQVVAHWPGAIATRGPCLAHASIATEAGLIFQDFDAFADGAADFLRDWCNRNADHLGAWDALSGHVEIIAVGWSKSQGKARAFTVGSRDDASLAAERGLSLEENAYLQKPFEVIEIETGCVRPLPSPEYQRAAGLDMDADLDAMESLSGFGTRIICAQRMMREPLTAGGEPLCFVGGFVMITHVDRTGVHMSKGAAFPNVVGQRIEARPDDIYWPHEDAPPPPAANDAPSAASAGPAGMNRQQRRIWEAAQRKKGGGSVRPVR